MSQAHNRNGDGGMVATGSDLNFAALPHFIGLASSQNIRFCNMALAEM